jgi:formylglycine-generating enzyme required for sulfatase activity
MKKAVILFLIIWVIIFLLLVTCKQDEDGNGEDTEGDDPFSGVTKREMVSVPGGSYDQTYEANSFNHTISSFQMAKYEVTYELWYTVYQWAITNGYTFANAGREGNDGTDGAAPTESDKYEPVTYINWRDAMVWCNAYSEMAGLTPCYIYGGAIIKDSQDTNATACDNVVCDWTANGYRLPTEGEWQYAASYIDGSSWLPWDHASGDTSSYCFPSNAGTSTVFGNYAWYDENSDSTTNDVGTKTENQLLIFDMSGNVFEWCWDWYDDYPGSDQTDYRGPSSGSFRLIRGGSWDNSTYHLRVGRRGSDLSLDSEHEDVGFRVVRID